MYDRQASSNVHTHTHTYGKSKSITHTVLGISGIIYVYDIYGMSKRMIYKLPACLCGKTLERCVLWFLTLLHVCMQEC